MTDDTQKAFDEIVANLTTEEDDTAAKMEGIATRFQVISWLLFCGGLVGLVVFAFTPEPWLKLGVGVGSYLMLVWSGLRLFGSIIPALRRKASDMAASARNSDRI